MNAIVILNYNNWKETYKYIEKIRTYPSLDYIIVVDNCSPDGSYKYLKELSDEKVSVIYSQQNGGYNKGNNIGVNYAIEYLSATNIVISNPDIEVNDECLAQIFEDLDAGVGAVVAPIVYNTKGMIQGNCGWNLPSYWQSIMNCCLFTYKIQKMIGKSNYFSAKDYPEEIVPVEAVSGCFFGITKKAYEAIGGFDEDTFLYGEEVLLGASLKKLKFNSVIDKKCNLIHMDQGSKKEHFSKWRKHARMIRRAHCIYLKKHCHVGNIRIAFFTVSSIIGDYVNKMLLGIIKR